MADNVVYDSNLKGVLNATEKALKRAAETIGGMAETYAKKLCRVDTGLLRNSITHGIEGEQTAIQEYKADRGNEKGEYSGTIPKLTDGITVVVGSNVEYAPYNELGTMRSAEMSGGHGIGGGITPQPFLRPAIEDHKEEYQSVLEQEMKNLS